MLENISLVKEIKIKDFNSFKYDNYVKKSIDVFISSNLSKKGHIELKHLIKNNSFYPVHIIKLNENDLEKTEIRKLEQLKKTDKELFFQRYYGLILKQYSLENEKDLFNIVIKNINSCPFCKCNSFSKSHNYSKENTSHIYIYLICNNCKEILIKDYIDGSIIFDPVYIYNEKIKECLDNVDRYSSYSEFKLKINDELRKTETINF